VVDGQTGLGLAGASVTFREGTYTTTAGDGTFAFSLPNSSTLATVTAALSGYVSSTLDADVVPPSTQLEPILLVRQTGALGKIFGTVRNARDNQGIAGASVGLYQGQVNRYGVLGNALQTSNTDSQGGYSFPDLRAGTYSLFTNPDGFRYCIRTAIAVGAAEAVNQDLICSPSDLNQIRIVLTWGAEPSDLDAHLTGPNADVTRFNVYYSSAGSASAAPFAVLDVDDTSSYGPETITITKLNSGIYRYSVHDYTNRHSAASSALARSGAKVELYVPNDAVRTFYVPNQTGNLWTVFELSGNIQAPTVTVVNDIGFQEDPATIP
jgi:hypothetical protein